MSFYEDYVEDGFCCQCCGAPIGDPLEDDPCGFPTMCAGCADDAEDEA